jgi:hypothetical protein
MVKQISTVLTFLLLPVVMFLVIYFGMTLFGKNIEIAPAQPEQHMLSPKEPVSTCGNGVCEKTEREEHSCAADC